MTIESVPHPFFSENEQSECRVLSWFHKSAVVIRLRTDEYKRCSLRSLNLTEFFEQGELLNLTIQCVYTDTLDVLPSFNVSPIQLHWMCSEAYNCTSKSFIDILYINGCNMSMFSLAKLVSELKPRRLGFGYILGLGYRVFGAITKTSP